jgi:hypothetical protein
MALSLLAGKPLEVGVDRGRDTWTDESVAFVTSLTEWTDVMQKLYWTEMDEDSKAEKTCSWELDEPRTFRYITINTEGVITRIVLRSRDLIGSIPDNIGTITTLKEFDMSENALYGQLPESLAHCVDLERLSLFGNQLTGYICDFTHFKFCTLIDLSYNQLEGSIPESLGLCISLVELKLQNNQLSGAIPESIGGCQKLKTLWLNHNAISGPFPQSIVECTSLLQVYVFSTAFDEDRKETTRWFKKKLPDCRLVMDPPGEAELALARYESEEEEEEDEWGNWEKQQRAQAAAPAAANWDQGGGAGGGDEWAPDFGYGGDY